MLQVCPHCSRQLEFTGEAPRFCGYCGRSLGSSTSAVDPAFAPTLVPGQPGAEQTHDYLPADDGETTRIKAVASADPERIGGYRLLRRLGGGGMGTVYEAENEKTGQRVALKLIRKDFAASSDALSRFRQEGRLASQVSHPRCVFVLAVDEEAGRPYIVMELMPGDTLSDRVRQLGPLAVDEAVAKITDVIDGLLEAHRLGLIHRDVKPSNCFLQPDGRVKIGDFGLSKALSRGERLASERDQSLTRTGAFLGTPLYAAPEQVKGEKADQQCDVYSTCATLYYLLAGKAPFEGTGDAMSVMARIVADDPKSLRLLRPGVPPALDQVILKGLARDKRYRWRDLAALRQALQPFLPQRRGYVSLGLRVGAMIIDMLLLAIIGTLVQLAGSALYKVFASEEVTSRDALLNLMSWEGQLTIAILAPFVEYLLYFTLFEGLWGTTPGKWLLGLRVLGVSGGGKPTLLAAGLRALVFTTFITFPHLCAFLLYPPPTIAPSAISEIEEVHVEKVEELVGGYLFYMDFVIPLGSLFLGVGILSSTIRRRNGYRGLHEFASATRVVAWNLGWLRSPSRRSLRVVDLPTVCHERVPELVGSYRVRGSYPLGSSGEILVAQDSTLDRPVWIWRREVKQVALPAARRNVSRQTRWRWLAAGKEDGQEWDAFLATPGLALLDSIAEDGPMSWRDARTVLEHLSDEMVQAEKDGTLPSALQLSQVWLSTTGQTQLLDLPLRLDEPVMQGPNRVRDFLRESATLCLEGRPRNAGDPPHVQAAIPRHAQQLLRPLFMDEAPATAAADLAFQLDESAGHSMEVTRGRRLLHAVLHGLGVSAYFIFILVVTILLGTQASIATVATESASVATVATPAARVPSQPGLASPSTSRAGGQKRITVGQGRGVAVIQTSEGTPPSRTQIVAVVIGAFALLLLWSALTRGGLLWAFAGLALCGVDGQPLSPGRAMLRTLLAGLPILVLFLVAMRVGPQSHLQTVTQTVAGIALVVYLFTLVGAMLWKPAGLWYDAWARSRVVPQ